MSDASHPASPSASTPPPVNPRPSWLQTLRVYLEPASLRMLALGFSAGLPLLLVLGTLSFRLREAGIDRSTIGYLSWVGLAYGFKWVWAPLVDRLPIPLLTPWLGRRRSWMFVSQLGLLAAIAWLGHLSPRDDLPLIVVLTAVLAFLSATQDIALDAFRREILPDAELGLGNAIHVNAYRIAGLVPGSLALILADHLPWSQVFLITAAFMVPGLLMTLSVREPLAAGGTPRTLREAVVEPFREFFGRHGTQSALLVLAFLFFYKLGDSLCTALATPFYLDMGYTKTEIGIIAKNAGLWPAVAGGILGGVWMFKLGINRALWVFGVVQAVTILGFLGLAWVGAAESTPARLILLALVIGSEAIGVGLGTTAFVAFMARTTHPAYTATQLALFTSLMAVPRTVINAGAGWLVEQMGWTGFFALCFLLALPGMLLLLRVAPWHEPVDRPYA